MFAFVNSFCNYACRSFKIGKLLLPHIFSQRLHKMPDFRMLWLYMWCHPKIAQDRCAGWPYRGNDGLGIQRMSQFARRNHILCNKEEVPRLNLASKDYGIYAFRDDVLHKGTQRRSIFRQKPFIEHEFFDMRTPVL